MASMVSMTLHSVCHRYKFLLTHRAQTVAVQCSALREGSSTDTAFGRFLLLSQHDESKDRSAWVRTFSCRTMTRSLPTDQGTTLRRCSPVFAGVPARFIRSTLLTAVACVELQEQESYDGSGKVRIAAAALALTRKLLTFWPDFRSGCRDSCISS